MFQTKNSLQDSIRASILCDEKLPEELKKQTALELARDLFVDFDSLKTEEKVDILKMIIEDVSQNCPEVN